MSAVEKVICRQVESLYHRHLIRTDADAIRKHKIIIRFGIIIKVIDLEPNLGLYPDGDFKSNMERQISVFIWQKWGLRDTEYFLNISGEGISDNQGDFHVEVLPRIRGGNVFKKIFKAILNGIFSIFKPIIKPLAGIANAFLMLVKGILYIIMLLMWFLKFSAWFFTEVLPSIPGDIFGMVRFIASMLIDAVVGTIGYYFKKFFNAAGSTLVGAALSGWDNNPESDDTPRTKSQKQQTASEFEDSEKNIEDSRKDTGEETDTQNQPSCEGRKCYMTEAGTVPWTVILATVLFPPAGVFMELGLHGFIQILVCLLLTFMFYFPGLIYALILLYC
jgi:uncharacterized membrane protein YqaE (UPF0057 family)